MKRFTLLLILAALLAACDNAPEQSACFAAHTAAARAHSLYR